MTASPISRSASRTEGFAKQARRAGKASFVREITESLMGRKMIIGVDRLDYSRRAGADGGLREADRATPTGSTRSPISRSPAQPLEVPECIRHARSETAGRVNGRSARPTGRRSTVNRSYGRTALAGLYRAAAVGLVTPFRDGMNLVAKEYVAAQDPE